MIERVAQLAANEGMRQEFGARAREIAISDHEWDSIFARLRSDYEAAITQYASARHQE
jgi:glycosyltransferase involved in cell wall biosynthesis